MLLKIKQKTVWKDKRGKWKYFLKINKIKIYNLLSNKFSLLDKEKEKILLNFHFR